MNTKLVTIFVLVLGLSAVSTYAALVSYGWEDGTGTILGSFGNLVNPTNVGAPDPVHTGNRALRVTEHPHENTPEAYLAFVTNLNDGDSVGAGFFGYDTTIDDYPEMRIWAHYATSDNIFNYQGSASGNTTYTSGIGWEELTHLWTFDSDGGTRDALVIVARLYSYPVTDPDASTDYFIDDLWVRAPDTATIYTAPEPTTMLLLGFGMVLLKTRKV